MKNEDEKITKRLVPLKNFVRDGPFSMGQVRSWIQREDKYGLKDYGAVLKVGAKIYVDPVMFASWLKKINIIGGTK